MRLYFVFISVLFCTATVQTVLCQRTLSGKVINGKTKKPVEYASVVIADKELWAITDKKGEFSIKHVSEGKITAVVSCLGYAATTVDVNISPDMPDVEIYLSEDNLTLDEIVVTARKNQDEIATSYIIDHTALDHIQMLGIADAMSLLPGGRTNRSLYLTSGEQRIALRSSNSGEQGNPTFGTAIEVDGVRLSGNSEFGSSSEINIYGIDTRNIASNNIESIEVITGVPSVEYGDIAGGVVKINTRKGKSPFILEMATKPNTKQASLSKGFGFKNRDGVLNASFERTKSISNLTSPYTSYDRNVVSLLYENTFGKDTHPLTLTAGFTGNIGGYNSKSDPDAFTDTYRKQKDNTVRTHLKLNWLLNRSWITNVELSGAVSYSDKLSEERVNKSNSSSVTAIHGREEGYFVAVDYDENPDAPIVLIPPGYWYQTQFIDSKPLDFTANLKARLARKFGKINSNILFGADFSSNGNRGKGVYYGDMRYAPDWREYRYDGLPYMNNISTYLEERMNIRFRATHLLLTAGVRADMTVIKKSDYGTVGSLSPRFNIKYIFKDSPDDFVKRLAIRAGWGKAVKLPSFKALYPAPSYIDRLAFAAGTMADGTTFYAYHIMPYSPRYNPHLKWQASRQAEAGFEAKLKNINISVSVFASKVIDAYMTTTEYTPFSYKLTDQSALEGSHIPSANRMYNIDRSTGVVTVSDKTGEFQAYDLAYRNRNTFKSNSMYINNSPSIRRGVEWIVDFGKIKSLQTSVRWDGNWYYYRGTEERIMQGMPSGQYMVDGTTPYKYVGFYVGGDSYTNGDETKRLTSNVTVTTHIPAIRLIVSLRLEGTLCDVKQFLCEYGAGQRGFVIDDKADYFPSTAQTDIYAGNRYVGLYPLYYVSYDDMETQIPFAEKFLWARDNDRTLYNDLAKMVVKSNYDFFFNPDRKSVYAFANISVTKEIGNFASISFNAINFLNTMKLVSSSRENTKYTLYDSSSIPQFYYGMSVKIKL
jgi:outer membrane cobalamin receptor